VSSQQRIDDGDDPRRCGGTVDVAFYVPCAPLETGSAVVRFEHFSSMDRYKAEVAQRDRLLKGLVAAADHYAGHDGPRPSQTRNGDTHRSSSRLLTVVGRDARL
jgi:hypothetical protein